MIKTRWYFAKAMDIKIKEQLINSLKENNMAGFFVNDENDLIKLIEKLIPENSTVGCGDSVSLEQTGVFRFLRNGKYCFLDKYKNGMTRTEKNEIYIKNFNVNTFITGTNAITMDGKIFNIDGNGSRIAPIIYGPKQVIIVIGINKIVKNVNEAITRTRQIAAPLDAKRLGKETPCTKLNKCIDCKHEQRICNDFVLITRQFINDRIKIIIVNKELGH